MREKIIEIATKEIGTKENPANSNKTKYGKWFGWDGVAWCAIFVSYCYAMAGKTLKGYGWPNGFAGCVSGFAKFKAKGMVTNKPEAGDIVFYDWNADGRHDHVGIFVKKINDTYFEAIEGNTSLTNQSNGGEVMRRKRRYSIAKFVKVLP